ncbi:inositol oxygenase 4-like [Arachis stenosperma]|uniref:inositol oxygenase 4-like n=1 Tax=Arachis stenosperma TaxID=217475 RepID=UPI0025ABC68B|nr:inositol oxygenase 4-like [Arachis stenosperma]
MRGELNELQALFLKDFPFAYYIHCLAHRLELALISAAKEVCYVHQFFSKLTLIVIVVTVSPKCHDQLRVAQASNVANLIANDQIVTELCQGLMKTGKSFTYHLIDRLIRLVLTLPVLTVTIERSFSAMNIVKNRLRNKIEDEILTNCLLIYIEKIAERFDTDSIINEFYDIKNRWSQVEEKKNVHTKETSELVPAAKDRTFKAPENNAFGQSFRDYDIESERQKSVEEFYKLQHINQTYDFVKKMREHYKKLDKAEMSIWECCELLNEVVDDSDPDLDEPQIQHLLQTAEAIRKDYPNEDWLHLTALIHDLGKILHLPQFGELPQWAVVGDTFPVGCAFDEKNVHHKYFKKNPDSKNPAYNTKEGVYSKGCGLDNVLMSWGHDDYMYMVAKENGTTLPSPGLFIIRYHSFYPLHKEGAYTHLMSEEDFENLKWLHIFNKYDLYSKSKVLVDVEKVKPYYQSLIDKYFPAKLKW